jgi:hypothetical protein
MGFITTLTANNDTIHQLPEYPDLGDEIYQAILKVAVDRPARVGHTGMVAHESHHMDYGQAILIGGGRDALELGASVYYGDKEPELAVLKQLADKHGFVLHKKRKR